MTQWFETFFAAYEMQTVQEKVSHEWLSAAYEKLLEQPELMLSQLKERSENFIEKILIILKQDSKNFVNSI